MGQIENQHNRKKVGQLLRLIFYLRVVDGLLMFKLFCSRQAESLWRKASFSFVTFITMNKKMMIM